MLPQDFIRTKRDGHAHAAEDIQAFFAAYERGDISDYHVASWLMAAYFRGATFEETVALTRTFLESGRRIDRSAISHRLVDKHSTGGVGDSTSLIVVPVCAAAGVSAPMISGRGLGHTGGTLDKLESIPGFRTDLSEAEYLRVLSETGMAMAGQTAELVPLDRRIYALRDVTATIDIIPLIVASIMSKKIAGGADALVLDVKAGRGAFMPGFAAASELAVQLAAVGARFDLPVTGFITRMDEPLGRAAGCWVEVVDAVSCLRGETGGALRRVSVALAGAMIHAGHGVASMEEGMERADVMLRTGRAYEKFLELVAAQGGDTRVIEDPMLRPLPRMMAEVYADRSGIIAEVDALRIGRLASALGAGRRSVHDPVDHDAGVVLERTAGDMVEEGDVLCQLYSSRYESLASFREEAREAFRISDSAPPRPDPILARFDANGVHARADGVTVAGEAA